MTPTDARHGTVAGYRAGCREICCKKAISRYNEQRKINLIRGKPTSRYIDAIGSQRRLQALGALGWSITRIAEHAQVDRTYLRFLLRNNRRISTNLAYAINTTYKALCMTPAPATNARERQGVTRTLKRAAELGWLPPLAWEDIDGDINENFCHESTAADKDVDFVIVLRAVQEQCFAGPFNMEEKRAVVAQWPRTGHSLAELERLSGWNVSRYTSSNEAA